MISSVLVANAEYQAWLKQIKQRIHSVRMKVALAANSELITLYYEFGAQIVWSVRRRRCGGRVFLMPLVTT